MADLSLQSLIYLSPLWSLSALSLLPLIVKTLKGGEPHPFFTYGISFFSISLSIVLFGLLGFRDISLFSLHLGAFESAAAILAGVSALLSLPLFARNTLLDHSKRTEALLLFSHTLLGVYILALSKDFLTAFIGLETASITLYMLIAFAPNEKPAIDSAVKYFALSALASAFFLYGLSFIFGASGDISLRVFTEENRHFSRLFLTGAAFLLSGLLFKIAVFPFQFWLPDVYQGALTPVVSFMAAGMKSTAVLFTARAFAPFFEGGKSGALLSGLSALAVLTALFGNILALKEKRLKRLAAASGLGHSGYLIMALTAVFSTGGDFSPLFYYLTAYIFMTGGLFAVIQYLEPKRVYIEDLRGMFKDHPWISLLFSLFLLSLAGFPPLFGFFAKAVLFQPLIEAEAFGLLFWMITASGIGLFYYIKPLVFMLKDSPLKKSHAKLHWSLKYVLSACALGVVSGAFAFGGFL